MTTRGVADIVFCLDASESMTPCFAGVQKHVLDFISGLGGGQSRWDLRFEFVAYQAGHAEGGGVSFRHRSLYNPELWSVLYPSPSESLRTFTSSVDEFRGGLAGVAVAGDEAPLVALDFALDLPWRSAATCHRIVILMTDEPFEGGLFQAEQSTVLPALMKKIQDLHVMLFMVTPESEVFSRLSEVDRCEHSVVSDAGPGLATVDFKDVLSSIGKSVSASTLQQGSTASVPRGLFGQASWRTAQIARMDEA